jgi:hypothetical protein
MEVRVHSLSIPCELFNASQILCTAGEANFTEYGQQKRIIIKQHMMRIENDIAQSIGPERYADLVNILNDDWNRLEATNTARVKTTKVNS